ncbi:MAG TPA: phytanoyl-CoA dioxygenase family protein [Mycobacteriales bacterium]|nr:phytanoyl-CoA dioxygenase family protein [Mycobacteriales bacterium]
MTTSAPALQAARTDLEQEGYTVLREVVSASRVAAALRLLNLEIRRQGLTAEQIRAWQPGTFFPHLRWEPEVWGVLPDPAAELLGWQEGDDWAEPQILLRFPDEAQDWPLEPHVDALPPWAQDKRYRGVVGVALTTAGPDDGVAWVWPRSHRGEHTEPVPVPLEAGDALVMHPQLGHTGTLNLGGTVRSAIYFRLLTPIR